MHKLRDIDEFVLNWLAMLSAGLALLIDKDKFDKAEYVAELKEFVEQSESLLEARRQLASAVSGHSGERKG